MNKRNPCQGKIDRIGLLPPLEPVHRLVVETEVVADLVDHDVADELRHLLGIRAVLLDRPLIDVDGVWEYVAVAGVAPGEIDAAIEPVERVGRLDPHLLECGRVRPVLDDNGDVGELVAEAARQAAQGPVHQGLELSARHGGDRGGGYRPLTRSTLKTSLTSRMAWMM